MTRAKGSFDFLSRELVAGMAFSVERTYRGGQLASGDGVTLDCGTNVSGKCWSRRMRAKAGRVYIHWGAE